jgi:hypothetical protein
MRDVLVLPNRSRNVQKLDAIELLGSDNSFVECSSIQIPAVKYDSEIFCVRYEGFRQIFCLKNLILFMGLLEDIQAQIEKRSLSGGGWASRNGGRAEVETTCYALLALDPDREPALPVG